MREWLPSRLAVSVVPDRGVPTTKIGGLSDLPSATIFRNNYNLELGQALKHGGSPLTSRPGRRTHDTCHNLSACSRELVWTLPRMYMLCRCQIPGAQWRYSRILRSLIPLIIRTCDAIRIVITTFNSLHRFSKGGITFQKAQVIRLLLLAVHTVSVTQACRIAQQKCIDILKSCISLLRADC